MYAASLVSIIQIMSEPMSNVRTTSPSHNSSYVTPLTSVDSLIDEMVGDGTA
jgi:hypothetical protein